MLRIFCDRGGEGAEVVYALRNNSTLAKKILDSIGEAGQVTRKYYQRRLPEDTSKDYYFIQRLTGNTTPLLIEYGFIDNPTDLTKLQNNIEKYAEAVVKAVTEYAGYTYKAPGSTATGNTYTVKKGDTLYDIARMFGVSVNEIKAANNLTSNLISIGQVLTIPSLDTTPILPEDYIVYTVKKGDTLYSIAQAYNIPVNEIITFNQLPSTTLSINQQLLIPLSTDNDTTPPTTDTPLDTNIYTVEKGDSLWKIANKFGVTVDSIIKANNLTSNTIQIGDQLYIPTTIDQVPEEDDNQEATVIKYTVKSGDSLYSIAKKYGISANELKSYNNLNSNLLSIGQTLLIPAQEEYMTYYVKKGDSLYSIATEFNTTVNRIKEINNLTTNTLSIGQILVIPVAE